jgi:hypothetical protein
MGFLRVSIREEMVLQGRLKAAVLLMNPQQNRRSIMQTEEHTTTYRTFRSDVRADIVTTDPRLAQVIAWADENPVVWDIVTKTRSKAFGVGSCVYIGWAQRSTAPEAVLERLWHVKELVDGGDSWMRIREGEGSIFVWRARFTLEHYRDKGFRGGFFQQHDANYPRSCLTLDYTPETLEEVLDRFCAWMASSYDTRRITVDGETVRKFEEV